MPTGTPPTSHADGKLSLYYGTGSSTHEMSVYMNTVGHGAPTVPNVTDLANLLAAIIAPRYSITGWAWTAFLSPTPPPTPFAAPIVGTDGGGSFDSESWTLTKSGRGVPAVPGDAAGKSRVVIVPGRDIDAAGGVKRISDSASVVFSDLTAYLNDPTKNIVNKYGQSAIFYTSVTTQFNARLQERRGT